MLSLVPNALRPNLRNPAKSAFFKCSDGGILRQMAFTKSRGCLPMTNFPAGWLLRKAVAACQQAHPNEACGVWWKTSQGWGIHAFTTPTLTTTPTRYAIPSETLLPILKQIDREDGQICGWFHSHPDAPPFLSDADISMYWASSRWAWWPQTQILLMSPTQDAYAWCLYTPTASRSWEAVAWGNTQSNSRAETIL
ncbi:Mov34/MPN/PAD-1 family protein [Myxococcota bacterium]|nr:Mov34/MPN/PAD-1 family protein [Myxococcota bacterium]